MEEFNRWLQSRLTAHGFPVGPIDGVVGPVTIKALKAFERDHGLTIDGVADPKVVKALRASSSYLPPDQMIVLPDRDRLAVFDELQGNRWPTQAQVPNFYGRVGANQVYVEVPFDMFLAWDMGTRVSRISVHSKVASSVERVLNVVADIYSARERQSIGIDRFGGSLNVRRMRGGQSYSMHSWAIAIDFDPERNQLNWGSDRARLAQDDALPFWEAWEAEDWISLGRTRNFDWMHVQAARL